MQLNEVKSYLEKLTPDKIKFDSHFYKRLRERPISEGMVRSFLSQINKLEKVEQGKNERFKLWYKMSAKYSLVLIVEIEITKGLKVISAWNTNRKWQGKLRR